ncbi:hypothetical protein WA026_011679 [Henosepilachna vigintioctopunctata]|uniref:Uncharacterized protein n=1 Tax=Henosepilachna vigintioctopunctata TaxID=420089 RepID=A0AAW1UIS1_9CUCU
MHYALITPNDYSGESDSQLSAERVAEPKKFVLKRRGAINALRFDHTLRLQWRVRQSALGRESRRTEEVRIEAESGESDSQLSAERVAEPKKFVLKRRVTPSQLLSAESTVSPLYSLGAINALRFDHTLRLQWRVRQSALGRESRRTEEVRIEAESGESDSQLSAERDAEPKKVVLKRRGRYSA